MLVVAGAAAAGLSTAASTALPRATEDRPDEVAGEQVHFLYVLPTDAPDEEHDVNGLLTASIARMQGWLAQQSGGPKLRLDTYQGQPDITFVRTSLTPPNFASGGGSVRRFVDDLGFTNPKKVYIAYLGAFEASSCGLATRGGKAGLVWLTCALGWPPTAQFSLIDSVAMHETLHALGAVDECWQTQTLDGHVVDRRDIMFRETNIDTETGEVIAQLDPGRDEYWGHNHEGCTDVSESPYLDSNPISSAPKMRLGSVVAQKKVAGGRLHVRARVSNPGTGRITVRCTAKQGKRRLRVAAARYGGGTAMCTFAGVRRGIVSGKITVRSGSAVASRAFKVVPVTRSSGKR